MSESSSPDERSTPGTPRRSPARSCGRSSPERALGSPPRPGTGRRSRRCSSSPMASKRVAVLSDVHGNAVALQAVLEELSAENLDRVVFGGDLTWGPLPEETLALVSELLTPALFVRGN